jgi:anaerobic selenocysteine-containing dehydrogenase
MHSVCPHDCPSCCSLDVTVEDGRIADVTGTAGHPFTQGVICGKVRDYAERVHSPLRVSTPLRRIGAKGEGRFERVSWDDALAEITRRWREVVAEHGGEAILPFSYAGSMGQVQFFAGHPLFHALGASRLDRSICVSTAYAGWRATVGQVTGNDSEQMVGADLIVLWGVNAAYSTINVMTLVKQARRRGAWVVVIDPYRTATAMQGDEHLAVKPGTDAALALAVMHVLIGEGLVDGHYVERATLGFEALAEHVKAWPPERVAPIVGLDAATIVAFARRYGASPRSFIRIGIGLSRHDNGGMTCRTLACLPALTGAYADPHGGALLSSGGAFAMDMRALERPDLMPTPLPRVINMIRLGHALTDADMTPPVKALYVYSSNPAAVCPNQRLVLRGLARDDLFTVVHEQVMTDTAHYADLVLPATTSMEHADLYRSFGQFYFQYAEPVIAPQGEARSNWDVFAALARAMGVACEHYARGYDAVLSAALAGGEPHVSAVTLERLKRDKSVRLALPRPYMPFANGAPTPSGKVEFVAASLVAHGLPMLPTWTPLAEGPARADLVARFPLQCIVPPNRFFLNSSFSQSERLRRRQGTPTVMLAPEDAARRGIGDGDAVRVESPRGAARFTAHITDATRAGVAVIEGIWWHRFHPGGRGVNVLTDDRVADMGGGPAFHSNLVEVTRA